MRRILAYPPVSLTANYFKVKPVKKIVKVIIESKTDEENWAVFVKQ